MFTFFMCYHCYILCSHFCTCTNVHLQRREVLHIISDYSTDLPGSSMAALVVNHTIKKECTILMKLLGIMAGKLLSVWLRDWTLDVYVGRVGLVKFFNLPPKFLKAGHPGYCLSFCGNFVFLYTYLVWVLWLVLAFLLAL